MTGDKIMLFGIFDLNETCGSEKEAAGLKLKT